MTDLCYLAATDALRLFAARELSPVELVEAVLARADAVEPTINAFAETFPDLALKQAREAEARYAGSGPEPRRLEGIPVAIKEEAPVAGHRWTQGSVAAAGRDRRPHRGVRATDPGRRRHRARADHDAGVLAARP